MIKLIVGKKGSGKTKQLIELVNSAAAENPGSVLCLELGNALTFDIHRDARLVDYSEFALTGYDSLLGFLYGCYAQNYDLVHIFIDNITKLTKDNSPETLEKFVAALDASAALKLDFTITVSAEAAELPASLAKYL